MNTNKHGLKNGFKTNGKTGCSGNYKKQENLYQKISVFIGVHLWLIFLCFSINAQTLAPNAPGKDAQWATAGKQGVGTSASLNSKVWFTLAQGVMTEVYYPDVTVANVHLLQFVVVNPKTRKVETEQDDAIHQVKVTRPDSLSFQQINTAKSGEWKITKTYTTDIERDSVLIDVKFEPKNQSLNLYVYFDPSLGNSGMGDSARFGLGFTESFEKGGKSAYLHIENQSVKSGETVIKEWTNGYYQVSDGLEELKKNGKIITQNAHALNGNVASLYKIEKPNTFTVILSFADNVIKAKQTASETKIKGFAKAQAEYDKEWSDYIKKLPKVEPKYQAQFNMAAMQLKAHEDKTIRGANIASLTVPWGGGANANENNIGGYHLIWSRDLYQVATAFMAIGDKEAAVRALNFLFKVQQKPDGSFPQNSYLDGKPFWESLQLDEVAFPLILAHELGVHDKETYEKHVKKAADFIVKTGPVTPQERWEEEGGYSPSTIAAEIAGLVCAAEIAKKNGDDASAKIYLATADDWAANIEKWTVTKTGKYSKEPYYLRITQGKPDSGNKLELNNGAGFFDERDIVDAGFLELVRLGIKSPDDKIIQNSLKVIDQVIRVQTPNGEGFYRYNNDGYGEMDDGRRWNWDGKYTGKGRLWALLSGERGQYEIALNSKLTQIAMMQSGRKVSAKTGKAVENPQSAIPNPKSRLDAMLNFANDGLMIPEQIWDKAETPKNVDKQFVPELKFGEGTGSATPLAWSMAQFIRLAVNLQQGRNLDTPKVVYDRYVLGKDKASTIIDNYPIPLTPKKVGDLLSPQPLVYSEKRTDKANVNLDGIDLNETPQPKGTTIFAYPKVLSSEEFRVTTNHYSPKINKNEATFFYVEKAEAVEIVGDFTTWKQKGLKLTAGKISLPFAPTARVEYKLIVDGKWINDPLNPNKVDNGVGGENSFFTMPNYKPTIWGDTEGQTKYGIGIEKINSKIYGEREVRVYVPEGFSAQNLPVLYVQDGGDYQKRADAVFIQRNLVKANKIKPFIMVFLDAKDRMKEYWANDDYAKFLAEEVAPAIDAKYKTIQTRDGRALLGASLGGITAVNVGLKYPQVFGRIGGQSSSFWVDNEKVVKDLEKLDGKTKFKFYFDDGTLEGVEDSRKVVELLKKKGFDVTYSETEAGHNWTAWRDRLADAMMAIWK